MSIEKKLLALASSLFVLASPVFAEISQTSADLNTIVFNVGERHPDPIPLFGSEPFDFAASDLDLDGDTDLVVNWHIMGLDLYINNEGTLNHIERQASGIVHENNTFLYATPDDITTFALERPGIHIWHNPIPMGKWNIYVSDPEGDLLPLELTLRSNEIVERFTGVEEAELVRDASLQPREDTWAKISLAAGQSFRHIAFKTRAIGSDLTIEAHTTQDFYLGATHRQVKDRKVNLRMPDPHAMAWVNTQGSAHPELFVTRGGNRGRLQPPFRAKTNRFFMANGGADSAFALAEPGTVPQDYGRGRSLAWVDIDGDARNELYIGNKTSANALLVSGPEEGRFQDLASRYGLSFRCGDAFTWLDINDDGFDDLVFLTCFGTVAIAINNEGKKFTIENGEDYGIVLKKYKTSQELFEFTTINSLDIDADGDLDILVSGISRKHLIKVFENKGSGYVDASVRLGVDKLRCQFTVAADIDADGYIDLVCAGKSGLLVAGHSGDQRFIAKSLQIAGAGELLALPVSALVVADFNGTGAKDIVVGGKGYWQLLLNQSQPKGELREIALRGKDGFEPVGTVIRAHYKSGRTLAQRYGSAGLNGMSQFLLPLAFYAGEGDSITHFTYRKPGTKDWRKLAQ